MSTLEGRPALPDRSAGHMFALVRSGVAASRADLARVTGLAASTVSLRVEALLEAGYLEERVTQTSRRGRRPKTLEVSCGAGVVGVGDLGPHHARLGIVDLAGRILKEADLPLRIEDGPADVLPWMVKEIRDLAAAAGRDTDTSIRGIAVGLPGPVDARTHTLVSPARMPGWNGVDVRGQLVAIAGVPVLVDNDANLMAVGEHCLLGGDIEHLMFLKAGSGIGCGVIVSGQLYRGGRGVAGDITHVRVSGAPDITCSCGRSGCLEVVASGQALVRELRGQGADIVSAAQVLDMLDRSDPIAARVLRAAGRATGEVLVGPVSFFNPQALVIGGLLSQADLFVAALRSTLYDRCLPMTMEGLSITTSKAGASAGILGGSHLLLDHLFSPAVIDSALEPAAGCGQPAGKRTMTVGG